MAGAGLRTGQLDVVEPRVSGALLATAEGRRRQHGAGRRLVGTDGARGGAVRLHRRRPSAGRLPYQRDEAGPAVVRLMEERHHELHADVGEARHRTLPPGPHARGQAAAHPHHAGPGDLPCRRAGLRRHDAPPEGGRRPRADRRDDTDGERGGPARSSPRLLRPGRGGL